MKKLVPHILTLASALALFRCASSDAPSKDKILQEGTPTELTGSWKTDCVPGTGKVEMTFGSWTTLGEGTGYSDSNCQNKAYTFTSIGNYVLTSGNAGGRGVNLTTQALTMTPLTSDTVNFFNSAQVCSHSNWQLNTPYECPDQGGTRYQIYRVESNKLTFGKLNSTNDGSTAAKRPTEIDTTVPYHKSR